MKSLKIGDLIAKLPIIQGGMGVGISLSGLASAVANEGGIGTETHFTIVQHNLSNINKFGGELIFHRRKALSLNDSLFFHPKWCSLEVIGASDTYVCQTEFVVECLIKITYI